MVGDLPLEGRIPPPGNSGSARRAGTIRSEIVAGDQIAVAFDEQLVAVGAVGVFQFSNLARQIPCIDEPQASLFADRCGAHEVAGASVFWVGHFIVFVKGRYMPGNVRRDAHQELRKSLKLILRVIKAWNQERDDLYPEAHLVKSPKWYRRWAPIVRPIADSGGHQSS